MVSKQIHPIDVQIEDEKQLLNNGKEEKKRFQEGKGGIVSLKAFILVSVISLVILCSVTVYLSVFIGLYTSVENLTEKVVGNISDKITIYLDQMLLKLKMMSNLGADSYNYGIFGNSMREYLFRQYNNSGLGIGYFFGETSERYTITEVMGSITWTIQPPGFPGVIRDLVDGEGNTLQYNYTVTHTGVSVVGQTFYNSTIDAATRMGTKGAFGDIYYVIGGSLTLPYGTKLYDPVKFKQGVLKLTGLCRCAVSLMHLSNFLSEITIFERGFVLITEQDSVMSVAGTMNTTTADGKSSLDIFDITDKNVGSLMKDIFSKYKADTIPKQFNIKSLGVNYYVTTKDHVLDNLVWKIYIVVYEEDVKMTTIISIVASVASVIVIIILSLGYGVLLSHLVSKPICFLMEQFQLIKVFDLEGINIGNSQFSEINQIFSSINDMVAWLTEIKSFVPESVFNQIQDHREQEIQESNVQLSTKKSDLSNTKKEIASAQSSCSASTTRITSFSNGPISKDPGSIFKMGLSIKECSVIYIILPQYMTSFSPSEISNSFPNILTAISSISKQFYGDFQVISNSEFKIVIKQHSTKNVNHLAQECALKITGKLNSLNNQNMGETKYSIGVSSDISYIGNLGTNTARFFSIISSATDIAKNLSFLASKMNAKILIDEKTLKGTSNFFITRPIDRLLVEQYIFSSNPYITTVYELIKESFVENDEWMYELQNQNENKSIQEFHTMFDIFNNPESAMLNNSLPESIKKLNDYILQHPNDLPALNLMSIFESIHSPQQAERYCCKVEKIVSKTWF